MLTFSSTAFSRLATLAAAAAWALAFGLPAPLSAQSSDPYLNYLDHASMDFAHCTAVQSNFALYYTDSRGNLQTPPAGTGDVFYLFSTKEIYQLPYNSSGIRRLDYGSGPFVNGWLPTNITLGSDLSLSSGTEVSYTPIGTPIPSPFLGPDPYYIQTAMMTGTRNGLFSYNLVARVRTNTSILSNAPSAPLFTPGNALLSTGANSALLTTGGGIYSLMNNTGGNGQLTPFITAQGSGSGQLSNPSALAIGPDGLLYVLDYGNNRIQKFNRETGAYSGQFSLPAGATVSSTSLAISTEGHIYLGDGVGGGYVLNLAGTLLTTFHPPAADPSWVDGGLIAGQAVGVGSFLTYDGQGNVFTYVEGKGVFMYRDPFYNELNFVNLNILSAVTSAPGNSIVNSLSFNDDRAVIDERRNGTLTIVEPMQVRTGNIYTELGATGTIEGGTIVTAGNVTKLNRGTLILNNANTYAGQTIVQDGTLIVNGSVAGEVVVRSGSTLGGSGTISGLATFASGAHLAPGNSPGTITFTNGLTLNDGSSLDFQLGTTSDLIVVSGGTLTGSTSAGGITLNLSDAGGFTAATYTLFDFSGATTSSFDATDFTFGSTISGYTYQLSIVGSTLQLVASASAVPEPSTYAALAGLAALGLVAFKRRRK